MVALWFFGWAAGKEPKPPKVPEVEPAGAMVCKIRDARDEQYGLTWFEAVIGDAAIGAERTRAMAEGREPVKSLGFVNVHYERTTRDAADPAKQVVVFESGEPPAEVGRFQAPPSTSAHSGAEEFPGSLIVPIPEAATLPLVVHVIDTTYAVDCAWLVRTDWPTIRIGPVRQRE